MPGQSIIGKCPSCCGEACPADGTPITLVISSLIMGDCCFPWTFEAPFVSLKFVGGSPATATLDATGIGEWEFDFSASSVDHPDFVYNLYEEADCAGDRITPFNWGFHITLTCNGDGWSVYGYVVTTITPYAIFSASGDGSFPNGEPIPNELSACDPSASPQPIAGFGGTITLTW